MKTIFAGLFICMIISSCSPVKNQIPMKYYLYVGAYTQGEEEGIPIYEFNAEDGSLQYISTVSGVENPSYLAINSKKNLLLAVNELVEYQGQEAGAISSFKIDPSNGALEFINKVSTGGGAPCYVSMTQDAKIALAANYVGGNVSIFQLENEGKLNPFSQLEQHEVSGPDTEGHEPPHAHAFVLDPEEKYALAVDLGIDKVISYKIDKEQGTIAKSGEFVTDPGAGPRHLVFHENGKFVFIINELNSTITSCSYDPVNGSLTEIDTKPTLPSDFDGKNSCADIHISKDGRFLYGSNRGHDSIVVFEIDPQTGQLTYKSHHSVKGKTPRNFMIDPTGKFLLVANQNSNNIVVFRINEKDGSLIEAQVEVETSKPVCLKMFPKP